MLRSAASKVMWVGRATVFLVGLAVILALVFGVASAALAGSGVNGVFNLGVKNTVDAMTQLVSNAGAGPAGPMLRVDNNSTATGATGVQIFTEAGKPPMKVNSDKRVTNLNADQLDGQDASAFLSAHGVYAKTSALIAGSANDSKSASWSCDSGDKALSGSYELRGDGWEVASDTVSLNGHSSSVPANTGYYYLLWRDTNGTADSAFMTVVCLDIGTPHQ